ncbi:MAG TPA: hypothetical protein VFA66_10585 [Gaiellaceae bacterium]|nr:hypothetical protein [Gaiellaceae bacterium]
MATKQTVTALESAVNGLNKLTKAINDDPDLFEIAAASTRDPIRDLAEALKDVVDEIQTRTREWGEFIAQHPELAEPITLDLGATDDDAIVAALTEAARRWSDFRAARVETDPRHGAWAGDVAKVLAGSQDIHDRVLVRQGDVLRVARRLGKLVRAGRVRVVSRRWESTRRYEASDVPS